MIKMKIVSDKLTSEERQDLLEEKKRLLIQEAKSRGLVPGARFSHPMNSVWCEIASSSSKDDSKIYFAMTDKYDIVSLSVHTDKRRGGYIYYKGEWATLVDFKYTWEIPDPKYTGVRK